jgi:hypothetical protein
MEDDHALRAAGGEVLYAIRPCAQGQQLTPESRTLLPKATEVTPESSTAAHFFEPDPSGGYSRTLFETTEDPNFKIIIREFSFPPDRQPYTITLPSAAFLHILDEQAEISIAKQRLTLTPAERTAVPAGAPIEVVNDGAGAFVVRALIVEAK